MAISFILANIAGPMRQQAPEPAVAAPASGNPVTLAPPEVSGGPAGPQQAGAPPAAPGLPAAADPVASPALSPGMTVVVLQVLNEKGEVVSSIPTAQQLAAYRNGTELPPA